MSTTTLPRPPRVPRWAKITLAVLGIVLLVAGAAAAWLVSMLVGGLSELADDGRVQPDDARVVAAQQVADRELSAELDDLLRGRSQPVLARTSVSECKAGQHNWKVNEDDDLYCGQGSAALLRAEPARFRDNALALHEDLLARGWTAAAGRPGLDPAARDLPAVLADSDEQAAATPGTRIGAAYARGSTRLVVAWVDSGDRFTWATRSWRRSGTCRAEPTSAPTASVPRARRLLCQRAAAQHRVREGPGARRWPRVLPDGHSSQSRAASGASGKASFQTGS